MVSAGILDLCDALGLARVALVGHHTDAAVATEIAATARTGAGTGPRRSGTPPAASGVATGRLRIDQAERAAELTEREVKLNIGGSVHDPTDPVGRLLFNVLAMIAEFECDLIKMRTREGMKVARAKGRLRGKQPKLSRVRKPTWWRCTPPANTPSASSRSSSRSPAPPCIARWPEHMSAPATPQQPPGRPQGGALMARTWLSIRVDRVEGGDHASLWPRPVGSSPPPARTPSQSSPPRSMTRSPVGTARTFTSSRSATCYSPARPSGTRHPSTLSQAITSGCRGSGRVGSGEQFIYTFDLGDDWTHPCTVGPARIDPDEALGIVPKTPLPYWGWGAIPDQYGREFDGDDGETDLGSDPDLTDLPPLRPHCGPRTR